VRQAAANCLEAVAIVAGDIVLDAVGPFVSANFNAPDWRLRDAAVQSLGVILLGPSEERLGPLINSALPALAAKLAKDGPGRDPSPAVRDSAAWTIGKMYEQQQLAASTSPDLVQPVLAALNAALDEAANVATKAAYAIHQIAAHVAGVQDASGRTQISAALGPLIDHLLKRLEQEDADEGQLRDNCTEAIHELVTGSGDADVPTLKALCVETLRRLDLAAKKSPEELARLSPDDRETMQAVQLHMSALLQVLAMRLGGDIQEYAPKALESIYYVLKGPFPVSHETAFHALGSIADAIGACLPVCALW
jgi:importin subunit beta-1